MSAIGSLYGPLYGSPKASMISRDPDGINPNETVDEFMVGLEPVGSRAEESVHVPMSVSNLENEPSAMDIADLVGAPPPPPKMPPPKKLKKRTPKNAETKTAVTPKPSDGAFGSFDDDSLLQDLARSSSTMTTPRSVKRESLEKNIATTIHTLGDLDTAQSDDSLHVDAPPRGTMEEIQVIHTKDPSPVSRIVEERVKAAMELYQREELVLDDHTDMIELTPQEILLPLTAAANEKKIKAGMQQSQVPPVISENLVSNPTFPGSVTSRSETNQMIETAPSANNMSSPRDAGEMTQATVSLPEDGKKLTTSHRTASVERRQEKDESQKREQKRGFFKKLFRGRSKPREDEEKQEEAPVVAVTWKSVASARSTSNSTPRAQDSPKAQFKPALKSSEEIQYQGALLTTEGAAEREMATGDVPADKTVVQYIGAEYGKDKVMFFSQDPPDDEHGDPPVFSGRPLVSPTSIPRGVVDEEVEVSRLASVKSRIADMYDARSGIASPKAEMKHIQTSMREDDGEYFLAQDAEVSAITGAFGSKFRDPAGETNAVLPLEKPLPLDKENNNVDAYSTNFFVGGHSLPTPSNATKLRIYAPGQSQDPAGESPMHWTYKGKPTGISNFRDPIGESPVHAWKDSDPPLDHGVDDDAVSGIHDEKKEEDSFPEPQLTLSSNSATPFEQDFLNSDLANAGSASKLGSKASMTESTMEIAAKPKTIVEGAEKSAHLSLQTDIEKAGFKSASNTPVAGAKKSLTISTAAFTNAKAVAYLHRLQGEPSPRHTWHASKRKNDEPSPLAAKTKSRKNGQKNKLSAPESARKKPSPSDYGAHNLEEALLGSDDAVTSKPPVHHEELHAVKSKEGALFGAYNSKFQGRKPSKKKAPIVAESPRNRLSLGSRGRPNSEPQSPFTGSNFYASMKPGKITASAVSRGIQMRRVKRDEDIALGKSERVVITPKPKTEGRNRFHFFHYADEADIKDPIQRAGRRILSKSAIPIQCAARRYIAKREAVDRMWALIEIQSYYRRWRAEANLQANIHSAVQIQAAFRGWSARDKLKDMNNSATQIQKIVRGYLCQVKVYDSIYYIVRLQALVRGCVERASQQKKRLAATQLQKYLRGYKTRLDIFRGSRATPFQALYRGHKARQDFYIAVASAKLLQATWRSCAARISYQVEIVDIIITQSVARRWLACRYANSLRDLELFGPASIIQATWRGRAGRQLLKKNISAQKIQTIWRGFRCYTDYVFALVDILVVQRTARVWLAKRQANKIRQANAALKVQCCWRRHKAESTLLFSLVHIIVAQSVARRYLAKSAVQTLRRVEDRKRHAAIAIQKTWRRFWAFSHYIIVQYEVARIQALVRGKLSRQSYNLKLGCAIMIQATIRRHLAKNALTKKMIRDGTFKGDALALRERNAAKKIQFWWRIVLDWTKEKKAALTIERFFIHVRAEVDREIMRRERKKMLKQEKRRQHRRDDDKMLERAWLKTVDENTAISIHSGGIRSQSAPRLREGSLAIVTHRTPRLTNQLISPKLSSIGQEVDINGWPIQRMDSLRTPHAMPPTDSVQMATSEDLSEVSNITNPTVFNRTAGPSGRKDVAHGRSSHRMSTEDYIKKYGGASGLQSAPNRTTPGIHSQHFFSDDGSVASSRMERTPIVGHPVVLPPTPRSMPGTPSSRRRSSSTPRAQHSDGFGQVTQGGFSSPSAQGGRTKSSSNGTTPRSSYGHSIGVPTPRSNASSFHVPSPRIQVGYPPATPRGYKGGNKMHISRRDTAETESQTTYTQNSFSKSSPRVGHVMNHGNSPAMVVKKYPSMSHSYSNDGAELMYLGGDELGDEYGEV